MNLSVLFVDDDSSIISGIRRMMHPMRKEWELIFANGGQEAIALLEEKKVDVIISDIRMPGIDGTQLLTHVKDNYPHIVRITLSGFASDNLAMRSTRIVHQSLSKPTTPENIKSTIEKAYRLRQKLNSEELLSIVNGIENLPSLPDIYLKLEAEINSENSSIEKVSNIISTDPIITAKILQLTNSAFFGLANRISNITQALNYLGIKLIQNLVLSIKLFKSIDPNSSKAEVYENIWNHSNKVAFLSQQIAKIKGSPRVVTEDAYLGGLLHDIGKLILLENVDDVDNPKNLDFSEFEQKFSNTTHADIGAYLLGIWGLPDSIVEAVAFHHNNDILNEEKLTPAKIVCLANNAAKMDRYSPSDLAEENFQELMEDVKNSLEEGNNK